MVIGASGPTRRGVLALAAALLLAGCASTAPTPVTVYLTLPPVETATPIAEPTAAPTEGQSPAGSPSESPSESPSASPSESPSASPTSPAAGCTGSEAHKAYFVNAAKDLPWDVYCAVLPSGWWLEASEYNRAEQFMRVLYHNSQDDMVMLTEGRLCPDLATCGDEYTVVGAAPFDGLAGTLRSLAGLANCVVVDPKHIPGYVICSDSLTPTQVAQYAAAVIKVAKPGS